MYQNNIISCLMFWVDQCGLKPLIISVQMVYPYAVTVLIEQVCEGVLVLILGKKAELFNVAYTLDLK